MVGLAEKLVVKKQIIFWIFNPLALLIGCKCTFYLLEYSQIIHILINLGSGCIMNEGIYYVSIMES